jgi:hypothetical protein
MFTDRGNIPASPVKPVQADHTGMPFDCRLYREIDLRRCARGTLSLTMAAIRVGREARTNTPLATEGKWPCTVHLSAEVFP